LEFRPSTKYASLKAKLALESTGNAPEKSGSADPDLPEALPLVAYERVLHSHLQHNASADASWILEPKTSKWLQAAELKNFSDPECISACITS